MRLLLVSLLALAGAVYSVAAYVSYREEARTRETGGPLPEGAFAHPEANLRVARTALATDNYSDPLLVPIEAALHEAPSFYQPPLLMAAFYANRLERPEIVRESFEAALRRFPSNGRLHLTYGEWLLTPRATAPYRAFRDEAESTSPEEEREIALDHVQSAVRLEPELTREALRLFVRFQVPEPLWTARLPETDDTLVLVLEAMDRGAPEGTTRRSVLDDALARGSSLPLFRSAANYGDRWGERDLALVAAAKWRDAALRDTLVNEVVRATVIEVRLRLAEDDRDGAYELLRSTIATFEERKLPAEMTLDLLCGAGEEYLNRGQGAMAQGLFSEAAAMSRRHVPAYLGLARAYRAMGDLESSRAELERALEIEPTNATASRQMEEISRLLGNVRRR